MSLGISSGLLANAKSWPWREARKVLARLERAANRDADDDKARVIIFETGYGPSGLPHIGTFGEVVRTDMVRRAFDLLTDHQYTSKLVCFSDDLDGLRKIPDNLPSGIPLEEFIDQPLTSVPDPFGTHDSFGAHNNARLRAFLDEIGIDYDFLSATECYRSGRFNDALLACCTKHDELIAAVLPTLRSERRATYSPFLPICPSTNKVLMVPTKVHDSSAGTISYIDPSTGEQRVTQVTDGHVKLQWKADWAMRWKALGVSYEMAGKDLIESVKLSSRLIRIIGGTPPESLSYELFLDANGEKISKSRGNGLSINEWMKYGTGVSLRLFMYQKPATAKRLHLDVIPDTVDEYFSHLEKFATAQQQGAEGLPVMVDSPIWHIHGPEGNSDPRPELSYSLLINLAIAAGADSEESLWKFVNTYAPDANTINNPAMAELVRLALRYHTDLIMPKLRRRNPSSRETAALRELSDRLRQYQREVAVGITDSGRDFASVASQVQNIVFQVGKDSGFDPLRTWFTALYEVLLGQPSGPRFGSFVAALGVERICDLIDVAVNATVNNIEED